MVLLVVLLESGHGKLDIQHQMCVMMMIIQYFKYHINVDLFMVTFLHVQTDLVQYSGF